MSVTLDSSGDELDILSAASEDEGGMPASSRAAEDSSMYLRCYQPIKAELLVTSRQMDSQQSVFDGTELESEGSEGQLEGEEETRED
jgi:hypothetical protein